MHAGVVHGVLQEVLCLVLRSKHPLGQLLDGATCEDRHEEELCIPGKR